MGLGFGFGLGLGLGLGLRSGLGLGSPCRACRLHVEVCGEGALLLVGGILVGLPIRRGAHVLAERGALDLERVPVRLAQPQPLAVVRDVDGEPLEGEVRRGVLAPPPRLLRVRVRLGSATGVLTPPPRLRVRRGVLAPPPRLRLPLRHERGLLGLVQSRRGLRALRRLQ